MDDGVATLTSLMLSGQQTNESELQLAKRRVEREAADHKQKALRYEPVSLFLSVSDFNLARSLQREVERLRNRLERPSSATSSPRKQALGN